MSGVKRITSEPKKSKSLRNTLKQNRTDNDTQISYDISANKSSKLKEIINTKMNIQKHKHENKILPKISSTSTTHPNIKWECSMCSHMNLSVMSACKICSQSKTQNNTNKNINGEGNKHKIFAVFVCGPDPTQNAQDPNAINLRGQTYINLLQNANNNQEEWKQYMIYKDEFPSNEEMNTFTGIVITGSKHDAYTNDAQWKLKLQQIIRDIYDNKRRIKILGICFGHQMIMHALRDMDRDEVVVGRNKKKTKIEIGLLSINLTDKFQRFWDKYNVKINNELLWIHEAHQDVVYKISDKIINDNVEILAYSQFTDIEMYHVADCILGVQGHPEFSTEYLSNAVVTNQKYIGLNDDEVNDILNSMKLNKASICEWKYMFKTWLNAE